MTDTTQTTATETTATAEQAAPATQSINIADLQNIVRVIDHACEQGAFKGWAVIEQVFALRSKVAAFVEASLPPAPAEEPKKAKAKAAPAKTAAKTAAKTSAKATPAKAATKAPAKAAKAPVKKVA